MQQTHSSIDQVYVLNLERRPDRLSHFFAECEREGVPNKLVRVWKAVDGLTHTLTNDEKRLFAPSDLDQTSETGKGCMANQLSHLQILRDIVENDTIQTALVFQDDVRLGRNFWENVSKVAGDMDNIPIVFVGLHAIASCSYFVDLDLENQTNMFWEEPVTSTIGRLRPDVNPASLAFLITKSGAKEYLDHITKYGVLHTTDINMNKYLISKRQFCSTFPLLCTGNSAFKSDIFKYDDHAVTRDLLELLEDL